MLKTLRRLSPQERRAVLASSIAPMLPDPFRKNAPPLSELSASVIEDARKSFPGLTGDRLRWKVLELLSGELQSNLLSNADREHARERLIKKRVPLDRATPKIKFGPYFENNSDVVQAVSKDTARATLSSPDGRQYLIEVGGGLEPRMEVFLYVKKINTPIAHYVLLWVLESHAEIFIEAAWVLPAAMAVDEKKNEPLDLIRCFAKNFGYLFQFHDFTGTFMEEGLSKSNIRRPGSATLKVLEPSDWYSIVAVTRFVEAVQLFELKYVFVVNFQKYLKGIRSAGIQAVRR